VALIVILVLLVVVPVTAIVAITFFGDSDDSDTVASDVTVEPLQTTTSTTEDDDDDSTTSTTEAILGATDEMTSFETVGGDLIPVLEVPIVDAETAADLMSDVLFDGLDVDAENWDLEATWSELLPGIGFNDGTDPADSETISGLQVLTNAEGEDVMFVAVMDEDDNCSGLSITAVDGGWSSSQLFSIDGECSGAALFADAEADA
jgi:hypothetical protein